MGGAVDLGGPFPLDKAWNVRSRGRINIEVDAAASLELDASAGWGRIRTYGIDAAPLKWLDRNHVHGPVGSEPAAGARTKIAVETRGADVIVASADARERDFSGRGYRSRAADSFSAPVEDFVDDLGGEIPAFVRTVLDAAGQFVAESGGLSSGIVREVTRDVKRSVSEGLREVERAISEIEEKVPDDIGARLSKLGKEIGELVRKQCAVARARRATRCAIASARRRARCATRFVKRPATCATVRSNQPGSTTQSDTERPSSRSQAAKFGPAEL